MVNLDHKILKFGLTRKVNRQPLSFLHPGGTTKLGTPQHDSLASLICAVFNKHRRTENELGLC